MLNMLKKEKSWTEVENLMGLKAEEISKSSSFKPDKLERFFFKQWGFDYWWGWNG